ncbi:MAG: ISNCY family transposase [Bacteroidota bacterium]
MRGHTTKQLSFGEGFVDPSLFELDEELTQVDELLSEPGFVKPFEAVFDESLGRPGTPVEVYLRMMYLKFRWGLSYEEVEQEIRERLTWRRFCHLSLMDPVPDSTTLIKLNQRFGEKRIALLNKRLVKHLVKTKSIKPRRIRIDSTTLESHITYPTDIGLLYQAVKTLRRRARSLGQKITSHVRVTKKAMAQLGASLKTKSKAQKRQVQKTLRKVARFAEDTVLQSHKALDHLKRRHKHSPLQERFQEEIRLAEEILKQTKQKLAGVQSIKDRIVSFYDPEARVICKGKLAKPNEFGRTMQLLQDKSGVILDHRIHQGNPSDKKELLPIVKRFKRRFGRSPTAVATDKGYYSDKNLTRLRKLGVNRIGIPKLGRLTAREKRRQKSLWFKRLQRFRCGLEAAISMLKRCFSLGRILVRGSPATAIWTGFAIFSYNLWQMS